jgi:hypothetical protein
LRLQLTMRPLALVALLLASSAHAEDRVTIRGAYYREASTKVVQPMAEVTKDLPHGLDIAVHGLVDAITSPSVSAGGSGDTLFTEYRKEAGLAVGKTVDRTRVALSYRSSREPDYIANAVGLHVAQGLWGNSAVVALGLAYSHDRLGPILDHTLDVRFLSLSYEQALSPVLLAQVGYEVSYWHGFLCNPYDQDQYGHANCPPDRRRHVLAGRLAYYIPATATGLQAHYRFYVDDWPGNDPDPWRMVAHSVEGRVYQELGPRLQLRASYRFHTQGSARFWCNEIAGRGGDPGCYGIAPRYHVMDEKLGPLTTHLAELQLLWEARALAAVPLLSWFAAGSFELSYGRYFQDTHYGGAHILQTGYSLPF